jgi:carbon storage regulator
MLILTRKIDQTFVIGDNVTVTVLQVRGDRVRIGVNAPPDVRVRRGEKAEGMRATDPPHDACCSP